MSQAFFNYFSNQNLVILIKVFFFVYSMMNTAKFQIFPVIFQHFPKYSFIKSYWCLLIPILKLLSSLIKYFILVPTLPLFPLLFLYPFLCFPSLCLPHLSHSLPLCSLPTCIYLCYLPLHYFTCSILYITSVYHAFFLLLLLLKHTSEVSTKCLRVQ